MFDSARVRGGLRCYDAIDRVVEWVITFLVKSSLRAKAEQSQKKTAFLFFCSFFLTSSGSDKNLPTHFRGKKTCRTKSNGPVSRWFFFLFLRAGSCWRTPSTSGFSWARSSKRVARGAFSVTFSRRTILPLSIGGEIQCIHVYPCSWILLNFVQCSSSVVA